MICLKSTIIKNINGEDVELEVIRYFTNNDVEYLIYSLNEIDDAGYIKLYASKIVGNNASIISDEEEWNLVKEIIKQIVKNNRDGSALDVIDLNENNLNNVTLVDTRVFKLQGNLVTLLSENKNIKEEDNVINEEIEIETDVLEELEEPSDYEKLYNDLLIENENLKQEIVELSEFKEKIEKIKEMLD